MFLKLHAFVNLKLTITTALLFFSITIFSQGTLSVTGNGNTIVNGSATPSISNNTDFGSIEIGLNTSKLFILENTQNTGNPSKRLNNIVVSISGSSDFSPLSSSLGDLKGNETPINHAIIFTPSSSGIKTASVTITFSNGTNSPYTFTIQGTGIEPTPEINVKESNNSSISSGGNFNFGTIAPNSSVSETFSIENTGNASTTLNLTGNPIVTLTGDSEFSIVSQPSSSSVSGGNSESFIVNYSPLAFGTHNATLTILNDDSNENPYIILLNGTAADITYTPVTSGPDWTVSNITANFEFDNPYEITYGPDDFLWLTERVGKKVVKVSPADGTNSKIVMLDLSGVVYQTAGQDGLMGMAIHPDLYADINTSNNFVYLAYTYNSSGRKLRIARYTYNAGTGLLNSGSATTIIEGLDASNDHNSGRLIIGPDLKLYYTIGDQGANQFANACNEIQAQDLPTSTTDFDAYKGKVLRLNLDGTIPSDNPTLSGVKSHVFTYGHRNPQGIIFSSSGKLYSSEHGPKVDDELNIIYAGKNYGWPHIAGNYDNMSYSYCNWSSQGGNCNAGAFSDHNCPSGVTAIQEFDPINDVLLPNFQPPIGTYNSTATFDPSGGYLTWPTVAPSSIDIYEAGLIPNWGKSLFITTLKKGTIFRAKLNATEDALESQVYEEFHSSNDRYRDLAMDPNGITIYAITDSSGTTSGPTGTDPQTIENPGVIVKIQYKCLIGGSCDDGNPNTSNDMYDAGCNCVGTLESDTDNDGVFDSADLCPDTPEGETVDTDGCSDSQLDDDNDGVTNNLDICPGFDDNVDTDSDSVPDGCDACAGFDDAIDVDADGIPDGCDTLIDSDNDGVADAEDQCPGFDDTIDVDGDGIPDDCDPLIDSDNDGVGDTEDQCPGFDDTADLDSDGVADGCDACPGFDDAIDVDADDIPDGCDSFIDSDNDGVIDSEDQCPGFDDTIDVDADGIPDDCDPLIDSDDDGVADSEDQCPGFDDNLDADGDGIPDGCDSACEDLITPFNQNPLTHSGSGSNTTILDLPGISEDISFNISGLNSVTNGKPSDRFIDLVTISYIDVNDVTQLYGIFDGSNVSNVNVVQDGVVKRIIVSLTDGLSGNTNSNMSIDLSPVSYCSTNVSSKIADNKKVINGAIVEAIKIYPNPTSHNLFIECDALNGEEAIISLYNIMGQLIRKIDLDGNYKTLQEINIDGLSEGVYMLNISDSKGRILKTDRIIINHE